MKLRSNLGPYCWAASESTTIMIEKTMPATVISAGWRRQDKTARAASVTAAVQPPPACLRIAA